MKRWAFFYVMGNGTKWADGRMMFDPALVVPIPACGSDACIRLDGRARQSWAKKEAGRVCRQRGYIGFRIERGISLLHTRKETEYIAVEPLVPAAKEGTVRS